MQVRDLMTTDVITVGTDDEIGRAERLMVEARIRHLPVVDSDFNLVGLITQRDLYRASLSYLHGSDEAEERLKTSVTVATIMTTNVLAVSPGAPLLEAARRMRENKYGCLPVVGGTDRTLQGILTETDFIRLGEAVLAHDPEVVRAALGRSVS